MVASLLEFSLEPLKDCWDEVIDMAEAHWKETEQYQTFPLNPDKDLYIHYNDIGYHRQYMARKDGKAVGYLGIYVRKSMHTQVMIATEDNLYLRPEARGGRNAKRFVEFVENDLKSIGVREVLMHSKFANSSERLMKFLGYQSVGTLCVKRLV